MSNNERVLLWSLASTVLCLQASAGDPLYSIVPIRPPAFEGADGSSGGVALNDFGQVLGGYRVVYPTGTQGARTFLYTDGMGTTDLPAPSSWVLGSAGINNHGQMAVYGAMAGGGAELRAYRYTPATGLDPLGTFDGSQAEAREICGVKF